VHIGGAVMWVGGAGLMFAAMLAVFFAWSRETAGDGGLGWLETARRANFAAQVGAHREDGASPGVPAQAARAGADESVDDDEHLAAYNAYLARLNEQHDR
jgi:putative copper resistance protein D